MKLAVLANETARQEWLMKPASEASILWVNNIDELAQTEADAYFDLEFEFHKERMDKLTSLNAPVFINSVIQPLIESEMSSAVMEDGQFIRINAWPTFLQRELTEVAITDPFGETVVRDVFTALGWKFRIVPDVPGMISARIIAMVINEAYYTLQAEVSTKAEIDTAMKLGTNYPYGPFEWSEKIGLKRIHDLLNALSKLDKRYEPSEKLVEEYRMLKAENVKS